MSITEKIIKFLNRNNPEMISDKIAQSFNERRENGEKDPLDKTVEDIIQIMKEHPDIKRTILANIADNEEIPDKIFEKTAIEISKSDELPTSMVAKVVKKNDISDESINRIIKGGKFGLNESIKLLKNIDDEKKRELATTDILKVLYNVCDEKLDGEVVEIINEIRKTITENDVIYNLIQQVVSKKMAENYYNYKDTLIYRFTGIIPVEKMLEEDLPAKVEKEYIKIEKKKESKNNFDRNKFKKLIINEMAKEIMGEYKKTGVFVIPHVKGITKEEEKYCIQKIQAMHNKKLSKKEIIDIENQIEGKNVNNNSLKSIKKILDENQNTNVSLLVKIIENKNSLTTLSMMEESGLIDRLNGLPEDKRKKTIEIMGSAIEKRNNITVVKPSKIEKQQLKTHPKEPEGREEDK